MKAKWLSRHALTEEQKALLRLYVGDWELEIEEGQVVWSSTEDEAADNEENALKWAELAEDADIVVGIFPPVSVVGLVTARGRADGDGGEPSKRFERVSELKVLTPVSDVGTFISANGERKKSFQFLRWQEL